METIIFENPGEIDLRSISTFGVSVKEGDNPIGFFGTGLKYAIAVLLRTGHQVTIYAGEQTVEFGKRTESVRGKSFEFVTMSINGASAEAIGFTTDLGKQWELWMAYREIACNCKDEGGHAQHLLGLRLSGKAGHTVICVTGDDFAAVHSLRHQYLLEDAPDFILGTFEVRRRPSRAMYYRGVRVMDLQHDALFTYNETAKVELTEDRTVKNPYVVNYQLASAVLACDDAPFLRKLLTANQNTFEGALDLHWTGLRPGQTFMKVMGECIADRVTRVNKSAVAVFNQYCTEMVKPREIEMTRVQQKCMDKALDFCGRIGFQIRGSYPISVVESLGEGCLGLAKDETIYIAERVFHLGGTKQLASTLIEEYLHLRQGWADCTRELQSFLFDKLVSLGEELTGEPL